MAADETELSIENYWDHGTLWAKTLLYVEIALERDRESWLYPFWSALALELLARTALSSVSPTLLANVTSDDDTSLLYALEKVPEHPGLKSVGANVVYRRCEKLFAAFTKEHGRFCSGFSIRRNQELHTGATPFEDLTEQEWLPRYFDACSALLNSMNKSLKDLFFNEAVAAQQMIEAMQDEKATQAKQAVSAHRLVWEGKLPEEQASSRGEAEESAQRTNGHVVVCPACGCQALVTGEEISQRKPALEDDLIVERATMLPTQLACVACGLKIRGHSKLRAVALGSTYTSTGSSDPIDYFGYEPEWDWDHNE